MFSYRALRYNYVMLINIIHFSNQCFNSIILVFYMFRTSYVHLQEDYIVLYCNILYYIVIYYRYINNLKFCTLIVMQRFIIL